MWRRSGSGWPRTLLDNVPLWLLQHGLQNPQADDDPKKNNEGNAGDTGGYYGERKISSHASRTVQGREAVERLPCLSSALWATIVAFLANPWSCQSGALPRYGQGCKSFGRRPWSLNPCWCRSRSSTLWPGVQANLAARLELLYCTMQRSDALVARTMFSRLCSKPSRGCIVLGPQLVAKTEKSGPGRGPMWRLSGKGSRSRSQALPHSPTQKYAAPLHH